MFLQSSDGRGVPVQTDRLLSIKKVSLRFCTKCKRDTIWIICCKGKLLYIDQVQDKKLRHPSYFKQNYVGNHPKKFQMEIQRFGYPSLGLKLSGQDPIRPHTHTQLQAKSRRAKFLNFHLKFLGWFLMIQFCLEFRVD